MKENKDGILIILVLFVIVGLAWDPVKKEAGIKKISTDFSGSSSVGKGPVISELPENATEKDVLDKIKEAEKKIDNLEKEAAEAEEKRNRSPYYGKISMSSIISLNDKDPNREYITLTTHLKNGETVNITGWFFKSSITGNSAIIGKASILPFPYTHSKEEITLRTGDRVYVTKGFSPINISFRTNKCTGYFEQDRTFYPPLSMQCAIPKSEDLPLFSSNFDRDEECRKIIEVVPRCTVPRNLRDLPDTVTSSCRVYLETQMNYNACVSNHKSDSNFPGKEWRVYLNRFGPLWLQKRDNVKLYDKSGLVVDSVSY